MKLKQDAPRSVATPNWEIGSFRHEPTISRQALNRAIFNLSISDFESYEEWLNREPHPGYVHDDCGLPSDLGLARLAAYNLADEYLRLLRPAVRRVRRRDPDLNDLEAEQDALAASWELFCAYDQWQIALIHFQHLAREELRREDSTFHYSEEEYMVDRYGDTDLEWEVSFRPSFNRVEVRKISATVTCREQTPSSARRTSRGRGPRAATNARSQGSRRGGCESSSGGGDSGDGSGDSDPPGSSAQSGGRNQSLVSDRRCRS